MQDWISEKLKWRVFADVTTKVPARLMQVVNLHLSTIPEDEQFADRTYWSQHGVKNTGFAVEAYLESSRIVHQMEQKFNDRFTDTPAVVAELYSWDRLRAVAEFIANINNENKIHQELTPWIDNRLSLDRLVRQLILKRLEHNLSQRPNSSWCETAFWEQAVRSILPDQRDNPELALYAAKIYRETVVDFGRFPHSNPPEPWKKALAHFIATRNIQESDAILNGSTEADQKELTARAR